MINYVECFKFYNQLIKISDNCLKTQMITWYQEKCRFYYDEQFL